MPPIPERPSLSDMQQWVADMCKERGFDKNSVLEKFLLFTEEVGELARAIRKVSGMHIEGKSYKEGDDLFFLREELADVSLYLFDIANTYSIDLESAIREKEEQNKKRTWKSEE